MVFQNYALYPCTARLSPRTKASRGGLLRLVVDPASLCFFDPETETALR